MLELVFFLSLIAGSTASCNSMDRTCNSTVQYPFGFSPSCKIQLSCDAASSDISFHGFPLIGYPDNNTFTLNISPDCSRPVTSASVFFSNNYALTHKNGLFLRGCTPDATSVCLNQSSQVTSQVSYQLLACGTKADNITCFANNTSRKYLTKDDVLNRSSCGKSVNLFTSVLDHQNDEGRPVLDLGIVEIGWWMTGNYCHCAGNATCQPVGDEVKDGYWCKCNEGFEGDGYADGEGCYRPGSGTSDGSKIPVWVWVFLALVVASLAANIVCCCYRCCCYRWCFRRIKHLLHKDTNDDEGDENVETELQYILNPNAEYQVYKFTTLKIATENFSDMNKMGKGGFGPVYKGILPGGQEIAVKRLSGCSAQGLTEFKNEVEFLAKLKHKNLVELLGCCVHKKEKLLCYEYLPNGSLDNILFTRNASKNVNLGWEVRHKIIDGIARGLHYLHEESRLKTIHRDLKVSNILLDKDMNPKISDFGLARFFEEDKTHIDTNIIAGTFGYMAPEYILHGSFSAKSDVYSFGVLLLEIVTGQKNSSFSGSNRISNLIDHALMHWNNDTVSELKDQMLEEEFDQEVKRCVYIALLCVQENPSDRPNMETVKNMLATPSMTIPSLPSTLSLSWLTDYRRDSMTTGTSTLRSQAESFTTSTRSVGSNVESSGTKSFTKGIEDIKVLMS